MCEFLVVIFDNSKKVRWEGEEREERE